MMELNEKIQMLRKRKGLTQEELAAALYVSRTAVSKWESGRGCPNIDSLKGIATYFGITIDELLSGDELLAIAREDTRQKADHDRDLVFGLLDCSAVMLWFLPLFGCMKEGAVQAVSLFALGGLAPYLLIAYHAAALGMVASGVVTLALQSCRHPLWLRWKRGASLMVNAAGVLLFIISPQPYAAALLFAFLAIKAFLLIRRG